MGRNEKKYGTIGLMILTVIIIFSVVGIVIAGFRMIKKNEDARLISAADTEYNKDKEKRQEIEDHLESDGTQEANTETETGYEITKDFINENVKTVDEAMTNAGYIIADWISDKPKYRKAIRNYYWYNGLVKGKLKKGAVD